MAVVGSNDNDDDDSVAATKTVKTGQRVSSRAAHLFFLPAHHPQPFYSADEMRSFRTLGLEPGKLFFYKR